MNVILFLTILCYNVKIVVNNVLTFLVKRSKCLLKGYLKKYA